MTTFRMHEALGTLSLDGLDAIYDTDETSYTLVSPTLVEATYLSLGAVWTERQIGIGFEFAANSFDNDPISGTLTGVQILRNGVLAADLQTHVNLSDFIGYQEQYDWDIQRMIFSGDDKIIGNSFDNQLIGYEGNDTIDGGTGADEMRGGTGNDIYYVDNSGDRVIEAAGSANGNDAVFFSASLGLGADAAVESLASSRKAGTVAINITGNSFAQNIGGNDGVNILNGQGGNDVIAGNGGNDRLFGSLGNDTLIGGAGNDLFFFDTKANATTNHDVISDFSNASGNNDTIYLNHAIYTTLAVGALGGAFASNTTGLATQADDRIIYESDTGNLFYDVNGSAAGGSIQFATLTGHPATTASDFVVY